MLMQQIKVFSPKCKKMNGILKMRDVSFMTSNWKRAFSCCYSSDKMFIDRFCVIDNKLLKFYKDFECTLLEGILDFDLMCCTV